MRIFCIEKGSHLFSTKNSSVFDNVVGIYEGCPSKSWTFVIARDFALGILYFFYYLFIYI